MTATANALAPVATGKTLDNTVRYGAGTVTFLFTGEDTAGTFSMMEMNMRPGTEPPYHIHDREDETFYVIEGHLTVMVDGVIHECRPGQSIFLPRGIPHTFKVRSEVAKTLVTVSPAGFEKYFKMLGQAIDSFELPAPGEGVMPSLEVLGNAAGQRGVRIAPTQPSF